MVSGSEGKSSWWGRFRALPNDDPLKTVAVTVAVAFIGSVLVAGSAVLLKPLQIANKEEDRQSHITEINRLLPGAGERLAAAGGHRVEAHIVDLESGTYVPNMDPRLFDQRRAAKDPVQSTDIPDEHDIAGLKTRSRFAVVYLVKRDSQTVLVILPVHGQGFGSMMYGYLGIAGDLNTVLGLTFYEHAETPGLGDLIDSSDWKAQWHGKKIWDGSVLMLGVGPGRIEPGSEGARFQVDALTGATWTGRGVNNLLHYWLGEHGFGPYLNNLRRQGN